MGKQKAKGEKQETVTDQKPKIKRLIAKEQATLTAVKNVSPITGGPQYRPQNTIILIIGTLKWVPLNP